MILHSQAGTTTTEIFNNHKESNKMKKLNAWVNDDETIEIRVNDFIAVVLKRFIWKWNDGRCKLFW